MKTRILVLFTRTPLHVGSGSSVGAVDQPIIRERHTAYPVIPGSAVKGVLRDYSNFTDDGLRESVPVLFGPDPDQTDREENARAGKLSFGEARLLAFPLRSAKGSFALATSRLALSRFARDAELNIEVPHVGDEECLAEEAVVLGKLDKESVALEEYVFSVKGAFPPAWAERLSSLIDDEVLKAAKSRFVLLSDGDFSHFALNACQVQHHNKIDSDTGTVKNGMLFNTETVPSETLFYAPLTALRAEYESNALFSHFTEKERLLQFGGDGTTGLGFCTVKLFDREEQA